MKNNVSGRDYKKEASRNKNLYKRYQLALSQEYGDKLDFILENKGVGVTDFVRAVIDAIYDSEVEGLQN